MSIDLQVQKGDTRDWRLALTDSSGSPLDLTSTTLVFRLRSRERGSDTFFYRYTGGAGSDFISVSDATGGIVRITPTSSDWADVSDCGVYLGQFQVSDGFSITLSNLMGVEVEDGLYD